MISSWIVCAAALRIQSATAPVISAGLSTYLEREELDLVILRAEVLRLRDLPAFCCEGSTADKFPTFAAMILKQSGFE